MTPDKPPPALVSITEASEVLGLGRTTAYNLARRTGQLVPGVPVLRLGGRQWVTRAQLDRFCEHGIQQEATA